ncbi:transcription termination factor 1 isoform X1 [Gopherus flavomarginatus]|uniref:transcription termination factor 1 isoform X1 n=1 Tax=Gopherus flavomarginatus TaxID=286002 RepID=UPI0021CC1136|nr:transcription termination factor 1 isoform X1 [Gopherus flavomarginatus]XP_050782584.1 transcription termination factor 1 isoform X1 [Gopherus flavomarginatus]XP_050782585.1 transcription termination factor 1 isoform X1 [Gopherus flavomarginatus]
MKKENREHSENLESNKEECMQSLEVCPHSPLLFEDRSSQDVDVHKKKSKKKKITQEKQDSWLANSYIGGKCEINNETVTNASKKKMKKEKWKHSDSEQEENNILCIHVNQEMDTSLEHGDCIYVNTSAKKKKRKKNLSEEQDEVNKLPGLYASGNDCRSQKKRKQTSPCDTQEARDETFASSFLSYSEQNSTSSQERIDDVMMSGSSTKMSSPVVPKKHHKTHKHRKSSKEDKADVTQISSVFDENPLDVTAGISKITSEGNNGCSEETMVPVRNTDFPFQSHSEQATSEQNSTSSQERNDDIMMSGSSAKMSSPVVPKKHHKTHKRRKSSKEDNTDVTQISSVFDENPLDVTADISKITSEGNNGCSEETMVPVRNTDFPFQSHSEQATSEAKRKLPESVASETEEDQDVGFTELENSMMLSNEELLESSVYSAMDLETVKRKLEEFIPQVWTMSETSVLKMAGRDLIRFKKFKEQGMPIKFGRFSQKENTQIQKNVEDFLSLTEIENAEKLLFTYRFPEEQGAITRLKTKYAFGMKIAEGIARPWKQVYFRARKMFDPNNYKGRYSEDEKEKLKKYHAIHGNNWKKISEMMSRSTHSVAMKYSQIKSQVNSGPWSKEETQKLVQAVKEIIQKRADLEDIKLLLQAENSEGTLSVEREKLYKNISWTEIEAKVGTRYWRQCKQKWISIVTKKMSSGQKVYGGTKGLQAKIDLIKRLYEMKVEDANEVNWEELCEIIGDVPEAYVQAKFYKLKATCVPSWQKKTFPEIIDYLYEETLPLLEKRLEKREKRSQSCDRLPSSCERKVFQFSDIFDNSEDDADDND